jgi:hypothetical protein
MKFLYKFFLLFFISINFALANVCEQNIFIKNKCLTDICYETKDSYISSENTFKIINNKEVVYISSFNNWVDSEITNNIINNYSWTFEIEDFCEWKNWTDCEDKEFSLNELISYNSKFRIDLDWSFDYKNYSNWKEYFLKNYNSILTEISWTSINISLQDIVTNLKNYTYNSNGHKYSLKNVCKNIDCTETSYSFIYWNNNSYKILKWWNVISEKAVDYYDINFLDTSYSDSKLKVWDNLRLYTKIITNRPNLNCNEYILDYNISYTYKKSNWQESKKIPIFDDEIKVNSNWNNLNTWNWLIDYTKINTENLLEIWLNENVSIPDTWLLFFYITVKDTDGNEFTKKVNKFPVEVISWDPVSYNSEINFINYNIDQLYYKDDSFTAKIYLKDIKLNWYSDINYWITINHSNSNLVFDWPNKLKSEIDYLWKPFFEFSFKFKQPWNYSKQFQLSVPKVDVNWNLSWENITFNLWDSSDKINIRPIVVSEIKNLRCGQRIDIIARCSWDDFSWCNWYSSETKKFDSEVDNWKGFTLMAKDNANNRYEYNGIMDHIDRTPPNVDFLDLSFKSLKATDSKKFKIKISDATPGWCRSISKVKYRVLVNKNNSWYIEKISEKTINNIKIDIKEVDLTNELEYVFKESWDYKIKVVVEDAVWNTEEYIKEFRTLPNDLDETKTIISVLSNNNKFANNSDYYTYTLSLKDKFWNPIYNKSLESVQHTTNTNNYLLENWGGVTNLNWEINFYLKSLYPFDSFNQSFKIAIKKWWDDYINNSEIKYITKTISQTNSFKKPISWKFEWSAEVWKYKTFKIKLNDDWNIWTLINWNLDINKNTIIDSNWFAWNKFLLNSSKVIWNISVTHFNIIWNIDWLLESPKIKSNNLEISYKLWWKNIKYYLDEFNMDSWNCNFETLGLKVIWTLQWDWKSGITWQKSNFSDLSKWKIRSNIRKNAYISIKNRVPWIINGIKYVNWDITIPWNENYETLIVKNWNVIITWDLNTSNKQFWIIILSDNYDVNSDYKNKWNVYVNNSVKKINAIIYADWTFRSANSDWIAYNDNNLENKLELYWSLFTRNTIGWAVIWNSNYTLPGGEQISDYDLAEIYDLNYIRKVPKSCDGDDTNDYSFVIKYNPSINSNPPKLFKNK